MGATRLLHGSPWGESLLLAVVQFPIADARIFAGAQRSNKPPWRALREVIDFVPRFGAARTRSAFRQVPQAWRDDAQYVGAHHAIRMRGVAHKVLTDGPLGVSRSGKPRSFWAYRPANPATDACFTPAFRRLLFDGVALTRVEIGFWVLGREKLEGDRTIALIRDLLDLETDVWSPGTSAPASAGDKDAVTPSPLARGPARRLGDQARSLARLIEYVTTPAQEKDGTSSAPCGRSHGAGLLQPTPPVVFIDESMSALQLFRPHTAVHAVASELGEPEIVSFPSHASVVPKEHTGTVGLAFTSIRYRERQFATWMVASDQPTDTGRPIAEVRDLRICLMRLHAARQVLLELRRLSIAGLIKAVPAGAQGTSLNSYLKALARQVLTPEAFGTNQAELNRVLSLYDLGVGPRERERIETAFQDVGLDAQVAERVNRAVHTETDSRAIEYFVYVDRRQIVSQNVNVTASGQGASIVIHEINQVAGNYLRESKAMGEDVKRDDLKKALEALHEQVTALAGRLPPGPQQEAAARKLKQVTEEAAAENPDKDVLKVTGKGLIEAAKTVAEMVGPVTTAVTGVLKLFALAL